MQSRERIIVVCSRGLFNGILTLALALVTAMASAVAPDTVRDELVAAVPENFPPYYLVDRDGKPAGYAVETMSVLADMAGFSIRYVVKPDWDSTLEALRKGEVDIVPNLGITAERSVDFDFTSPLETSAIGLFVRSDNTKIHGMDALAGKTAGVVKRNAAVGWLRSYPLVQGEEFETQEQALFALLSGEIDALIYPTNVTWKMASAIGVEGRIRQAGLPLLEIKRAIAVRNGNQALLQRLDKAVRAYTRSEYFGEAYARLHAKPQPFWTTDRLLRYGGAVGVLLWGLTAVLLLRWRARDVAHLKLERDAFATEVAELRQRLDAVGQGVKPESRRGASE